MIGPDVNPFVELSNLIDKAASKVGSRMNNRSVAAHMEYAAQQHRAAMEMQYGHERKMMQMQHKHEASQSAAQREHEAGEGAASRAHELEVGRLNADIFGQHIDRAIDAASGGTPVRVSHGDTTIEFERKRRTGGRQRNPDKD